ncbi:MAG: hypothetical protein IIA67_00925 [Planctomycetes bacterium]|nr:hypothetical protein [Planctomycetota bacterium]
MRPLHVLVMLALLLMPHYSAGDEPAPAKLPVPSREEQQRAAERIRGVFPEPDTPAKKLALAREILGVAEDEKDYAVRYGMLRYAGALAVGAGDLKWALHTVQRVQRRYKVDGLVMKQRILESLLNEKTAAGVSRAALDGLEQAAGEERYAVADAFGRIAYRAARLSKDQASIERLGERAGELRKMKAAHDAVRPALATLRKRPDDAAAHRQVGAYLCFWRGDWIEGLPHLAKGGHPIAKLETTQGKDAKAKLRIADLWMAEATPDAPAKGKHLRRRAAVWYRAALPELAGLHKVRAQKRLRELAHLDRPTTVAGDPAPVDVPRPKPAKKPSGKKSARSLAGMYSLLITKTRTGTGTPRATLVLTDEGIVTTGDGQPFAKWTAQGEGRLRLALRKPAGKVADFKRNADGTWRATLSTDDGRRFWTLRPVVVAAVWELSNGNYSSPKAWRKTLYSNGRVDDPLKGETWTINGNAAKIGKRGFTIDPDGRFAKGRQQGGGMMFARLICRGLDLRLAPLPKDKSAVEVDERRFAEQNPKKRTSSVVDTYQLKASSSDRRSLLNITIDLRDDGGVFDHGSKIGDWDMKGARLRLVLDFLGSEELMLGRSRARFIATNRSLAGANLSWSLERVMPVMTWQINLGKQSRRMVFYSNGRIGAPHALACHGPWSASGKGLRVWESGVTLKSGGRAFSGRITGGGSISGVLVSRP